MITHSHWHWGWEVGMEKGPGLDEVTLFLSVFGTFCSFQPQFREFFVFAALFPSIFRLPVSDFLHFYPTRYSKPSQNDRGKSHRRPQPRMQSAAKKKKQKKRKNKKIPHAITFFISINQINVVCFSFLNNILIIMWICCVLQQQAKLNEKKIFFFVSRFSPLVLRCCL